MGAQPTQSSTQQPINRVSKRRHLIALVLSALAGAAIFPTGHCDVEKNPELTSKTYNGVLGTSMTLAVAGVSEAVAERAMKEALSEVDRLDAIVSHYRSDSEVSALNLARSAENASLELISVIELCEDWRARSAGHFSCRLGSVVEQWQKASIENEVPDRVQIRQAARAANRANIDLDVEEQLISLEQPIQLHVSGLAKGYIIDRAFEVLRSFAKGAEALKVDIGGDGRYWAEPGSQGWQVQISTDPLGNDISRNTSITIRDGAVAASGHRDRGYRIGRRSFSQILQPRDGWPPHQAPMAFVVSAEAVDADAVATALASMSPTAGADWVNKLPETEALVIISSGQRIATPGWKQDSQQPHNTTFFALEYEIPTFSIGRYRRPYVAIWITNKDRKLVRNLLLLGESERWAKENTNWWREVGRRDTSILDGLARPTRRPGHYRVVWDGRDDFGQKVTQTEFILHIEAAREHGDADYVKLKIDVNDPTERLLDPDGEIGRIHLTWAGSELRAAY